MSLLTVPNLSSYENKCSFGIICGGTSLWLHHLGAHAHPSHAQPHPHLLLLGLPGAAADGHCWALCHLLLLLLMHRLLARE